MFLFDRLMLFSAHPHPSRPCYCAIQLEQFLAQKYELEDHAIADLISPFITINNKKLKNILLYNLTVSENYD